MKILRDNKYLNQIEDFWNERSTTFDADHDTEDLEIWKSELNRFIDKEKKVILDLGCGTGFLTNMLSELGHLVIGVDILTEMMKIGLEKTNNKSLKACYMKADVIDLPFIDESVDVIVNARLIWTILEPVKAMQEWSRVLKKDGKLLCFNRMKEGFGLNTETNVYEGEIESKLKLKTIENEKLINIIKNNGFSDVKIKKIKEITFECFDYDPWFVVIAKK